MEIPSTIWSQLGKPSIIVTIKFAYAEHYHTALTVCENQNITHVPLLIGKNKKELIPNAIAIAERDEKLFLSHFDYLKNAVEKKYHR